MCPLPWMGVKAFKTQIGHIQVKTHIYVLHCIKVQKWFATLELKRQVSIGRLEGKIDALCGGL